MHGSIKKAAKALIPGVLLRYSVSPSRPWVSLTFDDGPCPGRTEQIIKMLSMRGHRATFFVIGRQAAEHPQILREALRAGCEIGNHSYRHESANRQSRLQLRNEIEETNHAIAEAIGYFLPAPWFRPPRGVLTPAVFFSLWRRRYRISPVMWSCCVPHPERQRTADDIVNAISSVHAGDIVLLHDDTPSLLEALPRVLDLLDDRGLTSVTVSQLVRARRPAERCDQQPIPSTVASTPI